MEQYINKSAVIAKLKRRIQESIDAGGATKGIYLSERMKEDSYILSFLDSLEVKEFDMSALDNGKMSVERWKEACKAACSDRNYRSHYGFTETRDDYFVDGVQWADEHPEVNKNSVWHNYDEPIDVDKTILLISPNGNSSLALNSGRELLSKTLGGGHRTLREGDKWAYIEDLIKE